MAYPCHNTSQNRPACQLTYVLHRPKTKRWPTHNRTSKITRSLQVFRLKYCNHSSSPNAYYKSYHLKLSGSFTPITSGQRPGIINLCVTVHTFIFILLLLRLSRPVFLLRPFDPRIIFYVGEVYIIHELIQYHKGNNENLCSAHFNKYFLTCVRLVLNIWVS